MIENSRLVQAENERRNFGVDGSLDLAFEKKRRTYELRNVILYVFLVRLLAFFERGIGCGINVSGDECFSVLVQDLIFGVPRVDLVFGRDFRD